MLILKELQLNNFLSHSKGVLEFREGQKLLIDGVSGSGKSSIPEAIIWCLYGKGRTDRNMSLIKKGQKEAKVSLELIDDEEKGRHYLIERSISNRNKHSLSVQTKGNGEKKFAPIKVKGIKEVQAHLEDKILHSSYLLFINSIVYPQDNAENFVRQTAAKRKDLLLEIINATTYDDYLKRSKEVIGQTKTALEVVEARIKDHKTILETEKINVKKLAETKKEKADMEKALKLFNIEYKEVEVQVNKIEEQKRKLKVNEDALASFEIQISGGEEKLKKINERIVELEKVDISKLEEKVKELEEARKTLKGLDNLRKAHLQWQEEVNKINAEAPPSNSIYELEIENLNQKIVKIMTTDIEKCPELDKACPIIEANQNKEAELLKKSLATATDGQLLWEEGCKKHIERLEALGPAPVYSQISIASTEQKITELEPFEKELLEAKSSQDIIKGLQEDADTITQSQGRLIKGSADIKKDIEATKVEDNNALQEKFASMKTDKEAFVMRGSNLDAMITVGEKSAEKVTEYKEKLKELAANTDEMKEQLDALKMVKEAFGPLGIKTMVIDYVLPQLEDKINNVLSQLSDFRIRLDTQKSGLGKDTIVEGLFINIINDMGEEYDFDNYSGGERLKIIVAISEALAEIQKIGFRVLDELFIGLDLESTEDFTKVMAELQERFSQILCISHLRTIKDIFNEKITLVKTNGDSKIIL